MKKIELKGKRALVTGGSQGIGAEIAKQLAECGADVMVNYFNNGALAKELVDTIKTEYGVNAFSFGADVGNEEQVKKMFNYLDEKMKGIDVLVNNAGYETVNHVLEMTGDEWTKVMDTNLKGPFLCSREAGLRMENRGGGVIINISSIHDMVPRKGLIHYCSAKAGVKMLSKCLSLELSDKNIRVVSVAPGAIETNMNRNEIAEFGKEKFEKWIPQGRLGNVSDVANTVAFLASDLADYINGADIYIDGSYVNNTIQYDPRPERKNN